MPWYRIDVFRRCKTGEVIEATPWALAGKLRFVAVGILIGVPAVYAKLWFFNTWIPRYYAELDALAKIDPVASARKLAEFTSMLLLAPVLTAIVVVIPVVVIAYRVVRVGRWPMPGAKVRRRTEVIAGWCARLPALLLGLLLLACMLGVWWSYVRVVAMFWNGYLDKTVARMESRVAAQPPFTSRIRVLT